MNTKDLGPLENSFDFLEDLPTDDIWNVELDICGDVENFYFKKEENARAKFDEVVKKHNLDVMGDWATNAFITAWVGVLPFSD